MMKTDNKKVLIQSKEEESKGVPIEINKFNNPGNVLSEF